ncbi:MAG: 50S ribosomal protein L6 [Anaerolineae bacterium]|nr:50S ribosomal protein L6 [Anaerolineae bacterium]
MSRIGKLPIVIPNGVDVELNGSKVTVKGPKGTMQREFSSLITIKKEENRIVITRDSEEKTIRALHGTTRAVLNNMVTGVSAGFERILEVEGVGYKADMDGKNLVLSVGYSHPVVVEPPNGIEFNVAEKNRQVIIKGMDKESLGQIAADIRKIRPPEPYKGKGIHYLGEVIRRKAGKKAA